MVADKDFLKKFYELQYKRLEWHSKIEYRLLNIFIIILPVIITGSIAINEFITDNIAYLVLVVSMSIFLIILALLIWVKVNAEHKTYVAIAEDMKNVWKYFELNKKGAYLAGDMILTKDWEEIGKGSGYKKTLYILWAITISISIVLILFGLSRFIPNIT